MNKMNMLRNIDSDIFNNVDVGIYRSTLGPAGRFIEANSALVSMFGYKSKEAFLKLSPRDMYLYPNQRKDFSTLLIRSGPVALKELTFKRKDGTIFYAHVTATAVRNRAGKIKWFDGIVEDVTKSRYEQERFRSIFEYLPVAIWEQDFAAFAKLLRGLKHLNIKNIRKYLVQHPAVVKRVVKNIKIVDLNREALFLYSAKEKKELIANLSKTFTRDTSRVMVDLFVALAQGERFFSTEFKIRTLSGKLCDVLMRVSVPEEYEKSLARVIVVFQNITSQKRLEEHLKKMAQLDGLTRLLNSRAISRRLEEELARAKRYNLDISCLMVDLDYFKTINDKFGHQHGDQVLRRIAATIKKSLRRSDIVGRYGGDEFFIILTETKADNARVAAERLRRTIADRKFGVYQRKLPIKITLSVGISSYPSENVREFKDLIANADRALYLAKSSGRNCVIAE